MTKNGFKTLVEEDFDGSINGALAELSYRGECPDELYTAETLRLKVPNLLNVGEYELVSEIAIALMADTIYYRQDESHSDIIPVRTIDDVLDLFDDDVQELNRETVIEWIRNNNIEPDDIFDDDELIECIKYNGYGITDIFDDSDIMDYVKDNVDLQDALSIDWR